VGTVTVQEGGVKEKKGLGFQFVSGKLMGRSGEERLTVNPSHPSADLREKWGKVIQKTTLTGLSTRQRHIVRPFGTPAAVPMFKFSDFIWGGGKTEPLLKKKRKRGSVGNPERTILPEDPK